MNALRRSAGVAIVLVALLTGAPEARAQASGDLVYPNAPIPTAPVEVDGVVLFRLRGASAFPAEARAARRVRMIVEAAEDPAVDPNRLEIVEVQGALEIRGGKRTIGYVLEADARLEGLTMHELALAQREAVTAALIRYREARTPMRLGTAAAHALAATAALAALLALLLPLFRRLDRFIARRWKRRAEALEEKSFELLRADRIRRMVRGGLSTLRAVLLLALFYVYLGYVLTLFPWTRFIAVRLNSWVLNPLRSMGSAFLAEIPDLIFLAILAVVVRYGLKLLRLFFAGIDGGSIKFEGFDAEWAWPTYKIVRVAVIAFAVVVAYPYIPGSGSEAFKGVSLFAGVIFSLGSTSAISNIIAGYTMTYRRAFRVGDRVKIGDVVGDVTDIRLQVTTVKTLKNEEVVIPNATILNNEIVNYTSLAVDEGLILHTTVGIGYEVPWRQVEAMLLMAAQRTPGLLETSRPFVLQKALADYAVNYELNVYCSDPRQMMPLYTALHRNVQDVFNEHGVQIMTPSYVADPPDAKVVPKDRWHVPPAAPAASKPAEQTKTST
ncbi:MAG: mechanosensitive ion channel family protein [Acidobacteria bacterium]|jgi:small-conductance mechanosensitive channel|nr:mechanosensitive ion channel family protein [Acidobacteriota bacterium]